MNNNIDSIMLAVDESIITQKLFVKTKIDDLLTLKIKGNEDRGRINDFTNQPENSIFYLTCLRNLELFSSTYEVLRSVMDRRGEVVWTYYLNSFKGYGVKWAQKDFEYKGSLPARFRRKFQFYYLSILEKKTL